MSDTETDMHRKPTERKVFRDTAPRKGESGTIVAVLRKVSIPTILLGLLAALAGTTGVIAKGYRDRLEGTEKAIGSQIDIDKAQDKQFEEYRRAQNGHLHSIDLELQGIRGEQKLQRALMERIERKIDQR